LTDHDVSVSRRVPDAHGRERVAPRGEGNGDEGSGKIPDGEEAGW